MKKTLFALAAVAALALSSTAAMAEGFFAGASIGPSSVKVDGLGDDSKVGGKLFYGYNFNQNVGLELGYGNLGSYTISGVSVKAYALYADVVGTYPLANSFSLLGRVGVARVHGKASAGGVSGSENDVNFKIGAGLQYDISPTLAVRGEWERYKADFTGVKTTANAFNVGLSYKFN